MKRCLPLFFLLALLYSPFIKAQIKGNPSFSGSVVSPAPAKTANILNPDLQKLAAGQSPVQFKLSAATKKAVSTNPSAATTNLSFEKFLQFKGDRVVIDVTVKDDLGSAKAELTKLGAKITAVYARTISAEIPVSALSQLDHSSSIRWAHPAYKPMHLGHRGPASTELHAGSSAFRANATIPAGFIQPRFAPTGTKPVPVISQGDTAQGSYLARKKYNVSGKGTTVGVLSDSYNNLGTAGIGIAHGELPGAANPFNYKTPVKVLSDLDSGGTDEGRAMLEIVHDVAPGASLAFHTADNGQADFAQGILQLASAGCNVIADDVIYYAEPFFQDGIIAQAVDQVKSQGVTYFSAAGNESIRSYESPYRGSTQEVLGAGNGTAHNFSGPGDAPRYFQPMYIPPGGIFIASFQWDQPSFTASGVGCTSDLDIYLLDAQGNVVASGASDNIKSGDPIEVFGYQNTTTSSTFYLVILKYAGPDPTQVKYIHYGDALFYLTTPAIPGILAPTLTGHTKADGAISVGAAPYYETPAYGVDTPVVEGFSSVGGVANYYDKAGNRIAPLVRNKPEIVAPDGGNTSFFNPFGDGDIVQDTDSFPNFFGTSAATPHAAGVASLMIEAEKFNTITPAQIKGILSTNTYDMDNPYTTAFDKGFDFATGYGLIKAADAVGVVKFPNSYIKPLKLSPLCSPTPKTKRFWQISNPNPFEVTASWSVSGNNQHGSLTVPAGGDTTFSTAPLYIFNIPLPELAILTWEDNFGFPKLDLAYSTSAQCGKDIVSESNSDRLLSTNAAASTSSISIAEVAPNPSDGLFRLYLSSTTQQPITISLFSVDGKQLRTQRVEATTSVVDIDASAYPSGVYILKVIHDGEPKTIKLVRK